MAPIVGKFKAAFNSWIAYSAGLRHLFHKPYTLKFPQQRYAVEAGFRGRHLLLRPMLLLPLLRDTRHPRYYEPIGHSDRPCASWR